MSSPCPCVEDIIARCTAAATNPHGGSKLQLIRHWRPAPYGLRRIRWRRAPIDCRLAGKTQPPQMQMIRSRSRATDGPAGVEEAKRQAQRRTNVVVASHQQIKSTRSRVLDGDYATSTCRNQAQPWASIPSPTDAEAE